MRGRTGYRSAGLRDDALTVNNMSLPLRSKVSNGRCMHSTHYTDDDDDDDKGCKGMVYLHAIQCVWQLHQQGQSDGREDTAGR